MEGTNTPLTNMDIFHEIGAYTTADGIQMEANGNALVSILSEAYEYDQPPQ
jgi:hypothetical protein